MSQAAVARRDQWFVEAAWCPGEVPRESWDENAGSSLKWDRKNMGNLRKMAIVGAD